MTRAWQRGSGRGGLALAAAMALLPAAAIAQTTAFDGTYIGTTAAFLGAMRAGANTCPNFAAPAPLVIANGHAQAKWGDGVLVGDVSPAGGLVMRTTMTGKFEGQIDARGTVTGAYSGFCNYRVSWQRR